MSNGNSPLSEKERVEFKELVNNSFICAKGELTNSDKREILKMFKNWEGCK